MGLRHIYNTKERKKDFDNERNYTHPNETHRVYISELKEIIKRKNGEVIRLCRCHIHWNF